MITQTREDYIRALYILDERKHQIKASDVASYLNVSKPSVSEMMRQLDAEGYVSYHKYAKLKLTAKGSSAAQKLTSKHRLIERFLKDVLRINENKVHEEANRLEHAFSDESIERLKKLLGNPSVDPHGRPIF